MTLSRSVCLRDQLAQYLEQGLVELELEVPSSIRQALLTYLEDLVNLAPALGLSALREPRAVVVKHVLDSLLVWRFLPKQGALLDLGTGAGLPGLVIKIMQPKREVWLVDARKKAVSFLHYVVGRLKLSGVEIVQATVGKNDPLPRAYFKVVVSRAVTALKELWSLGAPLLAQGGVLLALKGPRAFQEIEDLLRQDPFLHVNTHELYLPLLGDKRVLVEVQKAG